MLISSRSFREYLAMFGLATSQLADRTVIDVAAGGADFVAAAASLGARAVAVDTAYAVDPDLLSAQLHENTGTGSAIVDDHPDRFTWAWYGDREARDGMRSLAAQRFTVDRLEFPGHYVAGALPRLPFHDAAADLVLCSHLLFTWSDVLDEQWHHDALLELARVGTEVRVFPLVVQATGDPIEWLPALCDELRALGLAVEERRVPYEFQTGADRMLVLGRVSGR